MRKKIICFAILLFSTSGICANKKSKKKRSIASTGQYICHRADEIKVMEKLMSAHCDKKYNHSLSTRAYPHFTAYVFCCVHK